MISCRQARDTFSNVGPPRDQAYDFSLSLYSYFTAGITAAAQGA